MNRIFSTIAALFAKACPDKKSQIANIFALKEILFALDFAAKKHAAQRRKAGDIPYINHPIEVALVLAQCGVTDVDVLVAAILHDTIEDTDTSEAELRAIFGGRVTDLVLECSDDKSLPKAERKRLQVEHASHKSDAAKLIKISDKRCNVRDLGIAIPSNWSVVRALEYFDWAETVVSGLRGGNAALDKMFDDDLARSRLARS